MPRKRPARTPRVAAPVVDAGASAKALRYATAYHAPVLAREVVDGLVTDAAGVYVDGTLGGGGHAAALLDRLDDGALVVGLDRDGEALATAGARLADGTARGRFRAVASTFAEIEQALAGLGIGQVDGVLLDLGVSSRQLDAAPRGFAFGADGPLDMRMDSTGGTPASDLVNTLDRQALADLFRAYGEEPRAWGIAGEIERRRPLSTTAELAATVRAAVPDREEKKSLARVFQALRIAVNGELDQLDAALDAALRVLKPGGRLAVIAYHSLEDRRVKHHLRTGNLEGIVRKDFFGHPLTPWALVTRHAVTAAAEEVAANPRARSARLRIAAKQLVPPSPRDGGEREGAAAGL